MNHATDSSTELIPSVAPSEQSAAHLRRGHRSRLFRKYLLLILTLVTIALLASGAISVYFVTFGWAASWRGLPANSTE